MIMMSLRPKAIVVCMVAYWIFACPATPSPLQKSTAPPVPDSLLNFRYIIDIHMDDPGKAQEILDHIRKEGRHSPVCELDYLQAKIYWRIDEYHLAIYYYERYLQQETRKDGKQVLAMNGILASAVQCDDYARIAQYAPLLIEVARTGHDHASKGGLASAYYHLGWMYWELNNAEKGIAYFDKAITILKGINENVYQEFLADYCINVSLQLQYAETFDKALAYNQLVYEAIERLKYMPQSPDNILEQYPVMYHILMANTLAGLGRMDEAKMHYDQFRSFPDGERQGLENYIVVYLFKARKYREILQNEFGKLSEFRASGDTITDNVAALKKNIAKAYGQMHEYDKAAGYYKEVADLKDSLALRERTSNIREFSVIHDVQEKENLIREQKSAILVQRIVLGTATAIAVLLAVVLTVWIRYALRLKEKNHSLYRQIREQARAEKEAEKCLTNMPEAQLSKEMQLFRRVSECMQEEKPFTNPVLNRKKLADRLNTNESYLADAIREGTGNTFSTYISDLRLQYALELLGSHPEMTLDAIAIDSGHGSYSPFFRAFSKKYGITPSEFRKLSAISHKKP
ncbi:MAG: helix-turn-helix domain-containing protein [Breznakibacter sp.]